MTPWPYVLIICLWVLVTCHSIVTASASLPVSAWLSGSTRVCLWKSHSLSDKLRTSKFFVYSPPFLTLAITQTWLHPSVLDGDILAFGLWSFVMTYLHFVGEVVVFCLQWTALFPPTDSPHSLLIFELFLLLSVLNVLSLFVLHPNSTCEHYQYLLLGKP